MCFYTLSCGIKPDLQSKIYSQWEECLFFLILRDIHHIYIAEPTLNINNNMRAKIKACGNNCYTCPILNISNIFTSTLTNLKYHSMNFDQDYEFLSCHSTNVIYLLTCNRCSIQYVGETVQPHMSSRMSAHIRTANKDSTEEGCRYLREHYTKGDFQIQDLFDHIDIAEEFCRGAAIKYLIRFGIKEGKNDKDLLK